MTVEAIITLLSVLVMILLLVFEVMAVDFIVFTTLGFLLLTGILTPQEAFIGFSNKGMLTVGFLFIIAYSAQASGILEVLADRIMGRQRGLRRPMLRMMVPVIGISGFLNNTPIVAMFTPAVRDWAIRHNISPSKFLIPLSYASIFGGICTLIGTSTNLVVNGLLQQELHRSLSMFELAIVGVPAAIVGTLYIFSVGYKILPDNKDLTESLTDSGREYLVEMRIPQDSPIAGRNVEQAGLRNLQGLFLAEIIRGDERLTPVKPTDRIHPGDHLVFTGLVDSIIQLQKMPGLVPQHDTSFINDIRNSGEGRIIEAVVSRSSPMLGQTIRTMNFRSRYDAAILAVHRNGERIDSKIGDIVLKPGDTLLLLAGDDFIKTWNRSREFYMTSKVTDIPVVNRKKTIITLSTLTGMIFLAASGIMDILNAVILAAIVLVLSRCITPTEARKSIEWNILIVIGCAFGISKALDKTGVADYVAGSLVGMMKGVGPVGVLASVYLTTSILTEVITNNAAAALAFPIAIASAQQINADPMPFVIAVAIAASASFATPIGYQTNLIIYGPGGYKYRDFLKIGLPLNLIFMVISLLIIPVVWSF